MENHSLIERIKSKDSEQELREVYSKYRNEFLLWAVKHYDCTMEEAKDVFQQTIVIFYENIIYGKVTVISTQVKTYLFGIGKNKILELLRAKKKNMPQFEEGDIDIQHIFYNEPNAEYEEKLVQMESSLALLGDPCKSILEHYYYHKKSMMEISEILDYKNRETVKNMKYKCLQRLKQIFKTEFNSNN